MRRRDPRGHRVFLQVIDEKAPNGFRFAEKEDHALPRGGSLAFADFDADGKLDALYAPFLDNRGRGLQAARGVAGWARAVFRQRRRIVRAADAHRGGAGAPPTT